MRLGIWRLIALAFLAMVLLSVGSAAVTGLIVKSGIDRTTARLDRAGTSLHNGQIAACVRANIQAAKDNRSQFADWTVDKFFVLASEHPAQRQSARERRLSREFVGPIRRAVAAKAWTPLIRNCTATVKRHGSNYLLPQPIPFDRRQPPPSALRVPKPPPLSPPASNHTP